MPTNDEIRRFKLSMIPPEIVGAAKLKLALEDGKPIRGVSYDPDRNCYRATLSSGKRQIFHKRCNSKIDAVTWRLWAEVHFGKSTDNQPREGLKRLNKGPEKGAVRYRAMAMNRLQVMASEVDKTIEAGRQREFKRMLMTRNQRRWLSRKIGRLMALVEFLLISGDLEQEQMQDSFDAEGEVLKKGDVADEEEAA